MRMIIVYILLGLLVGYILGIILSINAVKIYFISIGYKPRESRDMAKKIIENNGEIE
ncbi:hypothetical protein [Clostridium botulinum]|uniref:hypothetical protein n=1 Tax=Clostridium botulinum TaxID=1491 RepID=UPI001E57D8A8|nr:hypothetical protein [Clostridium botulinum]MCD3223806.1 hypothetical protein [Clostridium botulinum C/D]MCD3295294.1 hypothetical protein [Clostridium botulinum C/D]